MLSESLTKTKLTDPLILDLLQNIREHRSMLENLKSIKVDPNLTNIISNKVGRELYIENEFHKAKGFRKLHIEVAEFSKNLKILHCVFFPDPRFDIPIFGMDLVKINDVVSAAIVDLSPASHNQGMKYEKFLSEVDKSSFATLRDIPDWGEIFSKNNLWVKRPGTGYFNCNKLSKLFGHKARKNIKANYQIKKNDVK